MRPVAGAGKSSCWCSGSEVITEGITGYATTAGEGGKVPGPCCEGGGNDRVHVSELPKEIGRTGSGGGAYGHVSEVRGEFRGADAFAPFDSAFISSYSAHSAFADGAAMG